MATTGLEKITSKIISDAEEKAAEILKKANAEADAINKDYLEKANQIENKLKDQAEKDGKSYISRAKSAVSMQKRNVLLHTQSTIVEKVFEEAYKTILNLDGDEYAKLITGLLANVFEFETRNERENLALYGEEEVFVPDTYEVRFNEKDRNAYGVKIVETVKNTLQNIVPAEQLNKLKLSDTIVPIDGGFILHYGDVEANCTIKCMFNELRDEMSNEIGHILFDTETKL